MYRQMSLGGTEGRRSAERRKQAAQATPQTHPELEALLALQTCDDVPKILADEIGE
jgi:hypothetical protein